MSLFLQDLRDYLVSEGLATERKAFFDYYPDDNTDFITITCYDNDSLTDERSIQVMARNTTVVDCLNSLNGIYNNLFGNYQGRENVIEINSTPCYFSPLSKPAYLKYLNGLFYYVFNMKVTGVKE